MFGHGKKFPRVLVGGRFDGDKAVCYSTDKVKEIRDGNRVYVYEVRRDGKLHFVEEKTARR